MPKVVISDPRLFAAALLFVSTESTRAYLHGVHIEPAEGGGVLLSATGGRALFRAHDPDGCTQAPATIALPGTKRLPAPWLRDGRLWIDTEEGTCRHDKVPNAVLAATFVDLCFPDVERGVPRELSGDVGQFRGGELTRLAAASDTLGASRGAAFRILHNGEGPAVVTFPGRGNCFVVQMPARAVDAPEYRPELPRPASAPAVA